MSTKAIIFDFGNVIGFFDSRQVIRNLAGHTALEPQELAGLLFDAGLEDAYESGRISTAEVLRRFRSRVAFRCSDEELIAGFSDIFWPNRDVCALVPQLQGRYRLLVGSNTNELHTRQIRRQFADILSHFDALVLSHEVGTRKPQPQFFEHCCRLADCSAEECLFIDDLAANIAGARDHGLQAIHYQGFEDLLEKLRGLGIV